MKILFLCKYLSTGGAERVCVDVANELCRRGHNIIIITDTKQHFNYTPLPDISLIHLDAGPRLSTPSIFFKIFETLKKEKPDVVVSILYRYATLSKMAAILTCNCPVIASDHNSFDRPQSYPLKFSERFNKFYSNYYLDCLTVLTQADASFLHGRFKKIKVMPNPLTFRPLESIPDKEKKILAVGRLDAWKTKGFDVLLKAWLIVGEKHPEWSLQIVGSGSEKSREYLQSIVSGMENVKFHPFTEDIKQMYQAASIFVLSSRCEGFGLVLTEAMSQGCACIACDYKGRQKEIVCDNETGVICQPGNVDMLIEKLNLLIDDECKRKKMQEKALLSLERFSIEKITLRWINLFEEIKNRI